MDVLPEENKTYGTQVYWEERYEKEKGQDVSFDWFKGFSSLEECLNGCIPKDGRILHLGCGNSKLGEDMYTHGWRTIVNVDYSGAVIEHMRQRTAHLSEMSWVQADIFRLSDHFEVECFDYAIDKGTLDALLTRPHDPWNPPAELLDEIAVYMKQVWRALRVGGSLIHITFAQPHFRKRFLEANGAFRVQTKILQPPNDQAGFEYFCYIAIKDTDVL